MNYPLKTLIVTGIKSCSPSKPPVFYLDNSEKRALVAVSWRLLDKFYADYKKKRLVLEEDCVMWDMVESSIRLIIDIDYIKKAVRAKNAALKSQTMPLSSYAKT